MCQSTTRHHSAPEPADFDNSAVAVQNPIGGLDKEFIEQTRTALSQYHLNHCIKIPDRHVAGLDLTDIPT